jgi:hypothetical protein
MVVGEGEEEIVRERDGRGEGRRLRRKEKG